ncbi:Asp23/Gls24 family envelope stress response protein [Amycolatopsis rhabdoformis]|uniref:Asp23/Gls24 family envelope stress response protein n=1 Tax=Amycolatopsis rhabdoformis TaxID=1448059 RepID=A0ABZ1I187_9PSEU|nr:Asp23/Gls24 family envelope stress response protein [Amycolatopsis rhabdoformis]WSE28171.1 Asp23/Gls24 family envelope stress response protein [Amycolatopsis rhabdoformis]
MAVNQDYGLPCGRDLDELWDRLDDGADEHQAGCPHCGTARASLLALREATAELVAEPDPVPPNLVGRIMSAVRAEARRGQMLDLPTPEPGRVEVSEAAVAVVLRYAADSVGDVRARRCRVRTVGAEVEVELTLAVRLGNIAGAETLARVRERVTAAAAARVGLTLAKLDLLVEDVYGDEE